MKSTADQIRLRFDGEVDRFSNLETGQSATMDAPLVIDLIARAAAMSNPDATRLLDIGCGAGNYSLKLLERLPSLELDLIDLSGAMLARATERLKAAGAVRINAHQADIREISLPDERFDIVVAAAVLHHLRTDREWLAVFAKIHASLRPGGSFWIADLVDHAAPPVAALMRQTYGEYLSRMKDDQYRDQVFSYIEMEDTPRPLMDQIDLLRRVGFRSVEILHKHSCFAAFGAVR